MDVFIEEIKYNRKYEFDMAILIEIEVVFFIETDGKLIKSSMVFEPNEVEYTSLTGTREKIIEILKSL